MQQEVVIQLTPLVRRITAANSSVFTGPGTNTYLIGDKDVTVIDPGPALPSHIEAIIGASKNLVQILVTHTHPDHSPGVRLLQDKVDIPAYGKITKTTKDQDPTFKPVSLLHGDIVTSSEGGYTLEVIHTPGHASNHLCYLLKEEKLLFTGDHIMNGSTVVISPPDGNMQDYLDSLEKLKNYDLKNIAPGHGELLPNPHSVADWIIDHRIDRENKVIKAIKEAGSGNPDSLVEAVYDDVEDSLHFAAKWSLEAHLIKLLNDDRVTKEGNQFFWLENY